MMVMVETEAVASIAVVGKSRTTLNHNSFIADSGCIVTYAFLERRND